MIIGSGVFKKIVPIAQTGLSETWILLAWVFAGIATLLSAFNLSALASLTEESGGIYEYLRLSFGNFFSFLFGWSTFTVMGTAISAALAFILAQTINTLVPLPNPLSSWEHISIANFIYPFADSGIKMLAILFLALLSWINYRGVRQSANLNNIFTSAKIIGILMLIVTGLFYSPATSQTQTVIPGDSNNGGVFLSALFTVMLSALWAYSGWQDLSNITGEIKNPRRNVPLAIIIATFISMGLYVLLNYTYMHVLPLEKLASVGQNEVGAAVVAETLLGNSGKTIIIVLIIISVFSSLNGCILAYPRVYFRMAQESFFFKKAASVHPKFKTPHVAILYTLTWSCILVISGTFDLLTNLVIFAIFLFNGLLAAAVIKMKRKGTIRSKVIGYPAVQVVVMLFSLALTINTVLTEPKQSLFGVCLVLSGMPFYYYFKKRRVYSETGPPTVSTVAHQTTAK
jgi:APA family basic amino acid/polyamine antiporter